MTSITKAEFQDTVWSYYYEHQRKLPWRVVQSNEVDPYRVLVSEIMLQQTQVNRVIPKFEEFIETFPTMTCLAQSTLAQVLTIWNGLGYNRRAKYLHEFAKAYADKPFPHTIEVLTQSKGIGFNTAAAILVYSFDERHVFIETNIRTVYLQHFYADETAVADKLILRKVKATLPAENYREWYWALMDYGAHLKSLGFKNRQSKHYVKQSVFQGSRRQIRGAIIRLLTDQGPLEYAELLAKLHDDRTEKIVQELENEGMIICKQDIVGLP